MGLFDNRLTSSLIPTIFQPQNTKLSQDRAKYIYDQEAGCGVRVYSNVENDKAVRDLFWEIDSCNVDRSTTDVGGSFSIVLNPTEPWDEIISPDDYVRIFMGDQVIQNPGSSATFYNFASGKLDQKQTRLTNTSLAFVPIPGSEVITGGRVSYPNAKQIKFLAMYERMLGKVDRVTRIEAPPGAPNAGTTIAFQITGRSIGAILQDTSLYYNEWLPGFNAINVFYNTNVSLFTSPSDFVKEFLSVVLTAVPFPQWKLPASLVADLNTDVTSQNIAIASNNLAQFREKISQSSGAPASANAIAQLQRLVDEVKNDPKSSIFSILSLNGFKPTYGTTFNKNFMNSTTAGVLDFIKTLVNDQFNEFWVDLCPNGNPEGGSATSGQLVPTICMRQRPYDITSQMLQNTSSFLDVYVKKFSKSDKSLGFEPVQLSGISKSLLDLKGNSVTVFGPMAKSNLDDVLRDNPQLKDLIGGGFYTAQPGGYEMGSSGHDRINGFMCLGDQTYGQANQTYRNQLSANGGFKVDADSIKKYGFRMMETSTIFAQPNPEKSQQQDIVNILKNFSNILANWYFMNVGFLNGKLNARFLPEARIGMVCKYFSTRITPANPYPRMELSYIQGVSDNYSYGQPLETSLTLIRGLRYNLGKQSDKTVSSAYSQLGTARERVAGYFTNLVKNFGG